MFKSYFFLLSVASICLTGCSSNTNTAMSQMTLQQIDVDNFSIKIPVSYDGEIGDSSYLRQLHRQQITLKFTQEHYCNGGITIRLPEVQNVSGDYYYTLQYSVECNFKAIVS